MRARDGESEGVYKEEPGGEYVGFMYFG